MAEIFYQELQGCHFEKTTELPKFYNKFFKISPHMFCKEAFENIAFRHERVSSECGLYAGGLGLIPVLH